MRRLNYRTPRAITNEGRRASSRRGYVLCMMPAPGTAIGLAKAQGGDVARVRLRGFGLDKYNIRQRVSPHHGPTMHSKGYVPWILHNRLSRQHRWVAGVVCKAAQPSENGATRGLCLYDVNR